MIDINRLLTQLNNTGLQNKDQPLYQLLKQLIGTLVVDAKSIAEIQNNISNIVNNTISNVYNQQFNTDETLEETYFSVTPPVVIPPDIDSTWSVLTNGNAINPELIFIGGDVVMVHTP